MPLSLQDSYARSMACHGYGHGFYEPESADDVRPGYCGYIDESGRWQTILDLSKKEEMIQAGFDEPPIAYNMPTTKRRWGPKTSSAVVGKKTHIEAGASALPAGVPLDASVLWTYSHASDFGAVLLCSDDVVNEGIRQKSPYSRWALKNAKAISKAFPDVKAHGFFIVTSTWSTSAVSTTAWSNPSKQIEVGVKLGVAGVGDVGPSFEYYRAHTSGSWIDADPSRRNVLFFGGVYIKYRPLRMGAKEISQKEWESRSSAPGSKTLIGGDDKDDETFLVEAMDVGDDVGEQEEDNE